MDDEGNFVVVWDHVDVQTNGVIAGTSIVGRQFTLDPVDGVTPQAAEFTVHSASQGIVNGSLHAARNAQVAMDHEGNFIVTWEEYADEDNDGDDAPDSYGIFFQSYNADGTTLGGIQQANMLVGEDFVGQQVNPSVAMDGDGDFAIVWNGQGGEPDRIYQTNPDLVGDVDERGVFVREYSAGFGATGTTPEAIRPQERVNHTEAGIQEHATIAMEPDGDYIVVWSGQGVGDHHGIFSRRYDEVEDNAGPRVTDFTDTAGIRLGDGIQAISEMNYIVVTFDEQMYAGEGETNPNKAPNSILNPANWVLTVDGQELIGGIQKIEFGLNQSNALFNSAKTNKWEAVIYVDGNGMSDGVVPLGEGDYEITALNTLRDMVGNPLQSSGYNYLGSSNSRAFSVLLPDPLGSERLENDPTYSEFNTVGPQFIVDPSTVTDSGPNSPVAVAGDADGDYVAVWTDAELGGLYAHLTYVDWTNSFTEPNSDRDSSYTKQETDWADPSSTADSDIAVVITTNATARNASVARDADGDFVVTWEQQDAGDWNIHARRYDAAGNALGAEFIVNSTIEDAQQAPEVAMDHDGDFVITWQSNAQDGSGMGIYAQRFSAEGYRVGGQNAVQTLTFGSGTPANFTLTLDGKTTDLIPYTGNAYDYELTNDVENALVSAGIPANVYVVSQDSIRIEFLDEYGSQELPLVTTSAGAAITVETTTDGTAGEFRVNDVADNNQTDPSVAMDAGGSFVITWTSFGHDPSDTAYDGNIYGKLFEDFGFNVDYTDPEDPTGLYGGAFLVNVDNVGVRLDDDGAPVLDDDDNPIYDALGDMQPGMQQWSSVAMDMDGDFIVTWTGYVESSGVFGDPGHYDVFAKTFNQSGFATGNSVSDGAFRVNSTYTGDQQRSHVSADANGDYVITWEGLESYYGSGECGSSAATGSFGVFAQRFSSPNSAAGVNLGANGRIGGQILVNATKDGDQRFPSVAVDDTGDFVIVWCGNGDGDDQGVFSRRFDKSTDDAGPTVTDVVDTTPGSNNLRVYDGRVLDGPVSSMLVRFSEEIMSSTIPPEEFEASILNLDNWDLMKDGAIVEDAITSVDFKWNDTTRKYESKITFTPALDDGFYELIIYDDVTDMYENPFDGDYDGEPGGDFSLSFRIGGADSAGGVTAPIVDGRTFPETPGAVAVDRDGDTVVAVTKVDTTTGSSLEKAHVTLFDAYGSVKTDFFVTDGYVDAATSTQPFLNDEQRFVSVACDLDGDFVVTWTNYRDGEGQDVYGRLYDVEGNATSEPFKINSYTDGNQKWSNVDMDADGDFVVTWSSHGQEDGGQLGYGYGVYARRFDRTAHALAPEFQVNTTIAGNQMHSSVAVAADGAFIVAWQSDQNGIGDDIVYREFNSDGSATSSPLTGEKLANADTMDATPDIDDDADVVIGVQGNQRYPDVDCSVDGENYVITWASSGHTNTIDGITDSDGWAIFSRTFTRFTPGYEVNAHVEPAGGITILDGGAIAVPITVLEDIRIDDLDVTLTVDHEDPSDLVMWLESPSGQEVTLVANRPRTGDADGFTAAGPNGSNFTATEFNDDATLSITDPDDALPPFENSFVPEQFLSAFNNESTQGTWILHIEDRDPPNDPDREPILDQNGNPTGLTRRYPDGGVFREVTLNFEPASETSGLIQVNSTDTGHQVYPSVAVDGSGDAVFTWSGYGDQPGEEDHDDYGVYVRKMSGDAFESEEQRLNEVPEGQQWISSVGVDADGNYVVAWTGDRVGASTNSDTGVYTYFSTLDTDVESVADNVGPMVSGVYTANGEYRYNGVTLSTSTLTTLVVAFDESMSTRTETIGSMTTEMVNSIENLENWVLERNGSEIEGAVTNVVFSKSGGSLSGDGDARQ